MDASFSLTYSLIDFIVYLILKSYEDHVLILVSFIFEYRQTKCNQKLSKTLVLLQNHDEKEQQEVMI
jgi:hypothetical protein